MILNGKPLISYSIQSGLESKLIDDVYVSTEDEEIKSISLEYGAKVIDRPNELATNKSHTQDVIEHAINVLDKDYDIVITLEPTSPLRDVDHIDDAISKFIAENTNSLISIFENDVTPFWLLSINNDKVHPFLEYNKETNNPFDRESQEYPISYKPSGFIFITKVDFLKRNHTLFDFTNCSYYLVTYKETLDIDTENDVNIIKLYMER